MIMMIIMAFTHILLNSYKTFSGRRKVLPCVYLAPLHYLLKLYKLETCGKHIKLPSPVAAAATPVRRSAFSVDASETVAIVIHFSGSCKHCFAFIPLF